MNEEEKLRQKLDDELDMMSFNRLHELGNQAIKEGAIAGHGFRNGQYEILQDGEAKLMTPEEAQQYLEELIRNS
ncbi:hypothetical protein [Spirulina sp. 06S082]|uniref:hypothetical protein n=1 Tax=Spirulina sp. 06S082 TaxID=3110248 RepID=UPI002B21730F|nr:hypothetical protein [Spirulina sp. 06S082]MEA5467635.1 hypothetical protein [Spirulina sp. 06S082]